MLVKVYTRNDDPYSQMVKSLLQYHNIAFTNIEISRNKELFEQMVEISGQMNTPVLVIDEKVYCGFDREKIKEIILMHLKQREEQEREHSQDRDHQNTI